MQVPACIFVRYVRYPQQLFKGNFSKWQLNTHHLHARLSLTIYTAGQAQAPEFFIMNFSFTKSSYPSFKIDNVFFNDWVLQFRSEALHIFVCLSYSTFLFNP